MADSSITTYSIPGSGRTNWGDLLGKVAGLALAYPEIRRRMQREKELRRVQEELQKQIEGGGVAPEGAAAALPAPGEAAGPGDPALQEGGGLFGIQRPPAPLVRPGADGAWIRGRDPEPPTVGYGPYTMDVRLPQRPAPPVGSGLVIGGREVGSPGAASGGLIPRPPATALPGAAGPGATGGLDEVLSSEAFRRLALRAAMLGDGSFAGMKPRGFTPTPEQEAEAWNYEHGFEVSPAKQAELDEITARSLAVANARGGAAAGDIEIPPELQPLFGGLTTIDPRMKGTLPAIGNQKGAANGAVLRATLAARSAAAQADYAAADRARARASGLQEQQRIDGIDRGAEIQQQLGLAEAYEQRGTSRGLDELSAGMVQPQSAPGATPAPGVMRAGGAGLITGGAELSPVGFTPHGVTRLSPQDEAAFGSWYADYARRNGLSPNPDPTLHQYDYRGYWMKYRPAVGQDGGGASRNSSDGRIHLADAFKTVWHDGAPSPGSTAGNPAGIDGPPAQGGLVQPLGYRAAAPGGKSRLEVEADLRERGKEPKAALTDGRKAALLKQIDQYFQIANGGGEKQKVSKPGKSSRRPQTALVSPREAMGEAAFGAMAQAARRAYQELAAAGQLPAGTPKPMSSPARGGSSRRARAGTAPAAPPAPVGDRATAARAAVAGKPRAYVAEQQKAYAQAGRQFNWAAVRAVLVAAGVQDPDNFQPR